jgi:Transposase C of IS166 homeodomain
VAGVSDNAHQLPADIETLHALVAAARAERDVAVAERDQALSQIDRLRHLLRQLQRAQFGRRSEKLNPEQLLRKRSSVAIGWSDAFTAMVDRKLHNHFAFALHDHDYFQISVTGHLHSPQWSPSL